MDYDKEPIVSAHLKLRFSTASLVLDLDETHILFPAIEFGKKDRPLTENLNTDRDGPRVVQVHVHQIQDDQARSGYFGYSGPERLSLYLPSEPFADLVKSVKELRKDSAIDAEVEVDANGDVSRLTINGRPVIIVPSSGTQKVGGSSEPRTGTR